MSNLHGAEQVAWLATSGRHYLRGEVKEVEWRALTESQRQWIESQRTLQRRCRKRFPEPNDWLWTDRSLSQASDWWTAHFKARLFPEGQPVWDLCCGAGVDLVALAEHCVAAGVDADPTMLDLARANLEAHALQADLKLQSIEADFQVKHLTQTWLHIDPDRRAQSRRTLVGDEFSPPLSQVWDLALAAPAALIKLAPRTLCSENWLADCETQMIRVWCGGAGECRQQLWITGQLREAFNERLQQKVTERAAVLVRPNETNPRVSDFEAFVPPLAEYGRDGASCGLEPICDASQLPRYLYDLDATLHAADLQAEWAETQSLRPITNTKGYYAAEHRVDSPWVQGFEALEVVGWDDRRVRKALRAHRAGLVEVKNRLLKLDANHFQRRFSRAAGDRITLLVTRLGERTRCVLARRLPAPSLDSTNENDRAGL